MPEDRRKRILYFGRSYEFLNLDNSDLSSSPQIIDDIEVCGTHGYPESEKFFLDNLPFDLVELHLSADCAYYFAEFIRKTDQKIPITIVTGLSKNEFVLFDLARIEFPYDILVNRSDSDWKNTANKLVDVLNDINKQTKNA